MKRDNVHFSHTLWISKDIPSFPVSSHSEEAGMLHKKNQTDILIVLCIVGANKCNFFSFVNVQTTKPDALMANLLLAPDYLCPLLNSQTLCNKQDLYVSSLCTASFIHTFTIVADQKCIFWKRKKNQNFQTNNDPWSSLTFAKFGS